MAGLDWERADVERDKDRDKGGNEGGRGRLDR